MRLLALALFLVVMPLTARTTAASIQPFSQKYSLYRNGEALGVAELQYRQTSPGHWQFVSRTTATEGIAQVAGASAFEQSDLIVRQGQLELLGNRIETKVAWKTLAKTTKLVNSGTAYQYTDRKGSKQTPYSPGLLDQHSLTLALMADLRAGKNAGSLVYPIVNKGKLESNTFKIAGTQILSTALGKLNTVRVDRVRESSNGKSTSIWFASDRNFVPVMFQQLDENGDDIEMRILAVK
jgi:Protein of unknown function (DUF3108)